MNISLESLLQLLVSKGNKIVQSTPVNTEVQTPTSVRLKPSTRHFLEVQAATLNTSTNSLINLILDGVAETGIDENANKLRTIYDRFFYVFREHGLDLPSIVSIMENHGFTLSVLGDHARLLNLLDQKTIQFVANLFYIQPKWLSAASSYVFEKGIDVHWYKNTYHMAQKLIEYHHSGLKPHVMFIRREGADFIKACQDNDSGRTTIEPVGIIIRLSKSINEVKFNTYEVWEFERWNYFRCREQLKLLICFCDQAHKAITSNGYELSENKLNVLLSRQSLPITIVKTISQVAWYPEDYASLRFDVTKETEDWITVKKQYNASQLQQLVDSI